MPRTYVSYIVIIKPITRCVIKRWSNSKVWLRQWKIPIISEEIIKTIDKRELQKPTKEKQTKTERSKGTEAIVKGWELNDVVVHFS